MGPWEERGRAGGVCVLGVDCVAPALCPGYCGTENSFKRDVKKAVRTALCVWGGDYCSVMSHGGATFVVCRLDS